jgi:hypothetical protein
LCFDLNINYENLPGDTLEDKTRELILYCRRKGILKALIEDCHHLRPNADWPSLSTESTQNAESAKIAFERQIKSSVIISIENDTRFFNLSTDYPVDKDFINSLERNGWVRFSAGFKAGIYANRRYQWCIKILGMGLGENPSYFCGHTYYLHHEREMLLSFKRAGFDFQPNVMTHEESISFLVNECGISSKQAMARIINDDVLITELVNGVPLLTQTGKNLECFINPVILNNKILFDIGLALEYLKMQLDEANANGFMHNDPIGFNIILAMNKKKKVIAKLVDFELAQNLNKKTPEHVSIVVDQLYRERGVPFNSQSGEHTKSLDQHLMDESIQIIEQLSERLSILKISDSPFRSIFTIGPFASGIDLKLINATEFLRKNQG